MRVNNLPLKIAYSYTGKYPKISKQIIRWLFVEQNGRLRNARKKEFYPEPRDNRWKSIASLLMDLKFVENKQNQIQLTNEGKKWIQMIL